MRLSKLLAVFFMAAACMGILRPRPVQASGQNSRQNTEAPKSGSVNNEDCAVCHEEIVKAFDKNPHVVLEKSPKFNLKNSCESCHGPGEAHVESGGDKTKIISFKEDAKKAYNQQCLACHRKDQELSGFMSSRHSKSDLACSDCHRVHAGARMTRLLREPVNSLCMSCHAQQKTEFSRPYHHRIKENAMRCTDCHQPHSNFDRPQLRLTSFGDTPCLKCHSEKEGPFVFNHAPLKIRNCEACHEPHGSNNPKMLIRNTVRALCLECHSISANVLTAQPPSFHDVRSPRYQNCTTCHVMIHGSNSSPVFFR